MNREVRPEGDTAATTPGQTSAGVTGAARAGGDASLSGLLKQLADDTSTLVRKEITLAKVEVADAVQTAKAGVVSMAAGGGVLFAGFLVLLAAAVFALSNVVEPWLAALIVGGIVTIIGFIMVQGGKKKMEPAAFKPDHTMNSLEKDRNMAKEKV